MSPKKKHKFLIIDGHALIHRSFHAIPLSMKTTLGEPVNAVYGFTSFLLKAIKDLKPDMIALALDKKGSTFRHEAYRDYKATRVKAPDDLYAQIPRIRELANILHIPTFEIQGCEADDVIGTLTAKVKGVDKIIVTGDMDTLQLVDTDTKVYTMSRGLLDSVIYDEAAVRDRYGLNVDQMIEYKALRGDPSDNMPGVRGIGEKTAVELLQEFQTVEKLYKNINSKKISDRIRQLLIDHKDDAVMSRDLATIRRDIDLDIDEKKLVFGGFDRTAALNFFKELEFKSLMPRLMALEYADKEASATQRLDRTTDKYARNRNDLHYEIIDTDKAFNAFLKKLSAQKRFAVDTETSGFDCFTSDLLGLSFSWKATEAYYISVCQPALSGHTKASTLFDYNKEKKPKNIHPWLLKLKPILENKSVKKIGHNIKFDVKILKQFGIEMAGIDFDTMIAAYLINPGHRQYSLDALALSYFQFEKISSEELLGSGRTKIEFPQVPLEKLGLYASEDADITFRLWEKLEKELKKANLEKLFESMEMPLIETLVEMELNGISLDREYFKKLDSEMDKEIIALQKKIWKLSGGEFNVSSPKQLQNILFNKLGISTAGLSRTKTGISTGADELAKLKGRHDIIDLILNYREVTKLSSTYIKSLPELVNPITQRLHTSFNQTIAATGRLSSTDPNLQNIPIRTELGRKIRRGFVAKKGCELASLDYSQIELRIAAHLSQDKNLIAAFKKNQDIHTVTAAAINQIPVDKVTPDLRRKAKAVNFGILYGQGPHGLAQSADIPYEEARAFIDGYFAAYGSVRKFMDDTLAQARSKGYVETIFGRKRYLEEINASNAMVRKSAERMAINAPIQGSNADIIKLAMIEVTKLIDKEYSKTISLLLQVHDELLFEGEPKALASAIPKIKKIMENVTKISVPIIVEAKQGKNWEQMHKIS